MCIYSGLINNHRPVVYPYNSQILIFHRLFCLLPFAHIYSSVLKRFQLRKSDRHIITELRYSASTDSSLLLGSGKWTACGPSQPALQRPPHLCFASQHCASNRLWPSALAPSSVQQWTLKPVGVVRTTLLLPHRWEDHCGTQDGNDARGITPPYTYEQQFCFLFMCF